MVKVAIMGYGTIGSGVGEVLTRNADLVEKRAGKKVQVKYILDLRDFPGDPLGDKVVHDVSVIMNDPEVRIVVETMGGLEPAYSFVKQALENGKSVVTSNKELVAVYGGELLEMARERDLNFQFEASVGGGIPLIRTLNQSMTAEEIYEITGILNGTTNYILTRMKDEGLGYEEVLKDAQALGYAERNPSADVEGFDACRKIAILSSLAYGGQIDFQEVYTEGITHISSIDFQYARELKKAIKLFASSKKKDGKIYAMVSPVMIGKDHPLYSVDDVFNGVLLKGNMVDDIVLCGKGAGKLPTASAVVADVIDEVKHLHCNVMVDWKKDKLSPSDKGQLSRQFFLRLSGSLQDRKEEVKKALPAEQFIELPGLAEFGVVTEALPENEFLERFSGLKGAVAFIRMAA